MSRRGLINLLFWIVFSQLIFANELIDAASGAYHSLLLFKDGRIATVEHLERNIAEKFHFSYVESPIKFISIAAGEDFNLAVSAEGSLWGWGYIPRFHLGVYQAEVAEKPMLLDDTKKWESVFADGSTALALQEDGSLWNVRVLEDFREIQSCYLYNCYFIVIYMLHLVCVLNILVYSMKEIELCQKKILFI